ncbi:tyrosine-type recombinase/integrase, partial [Chloroflexota bacterium]
MNITSQEIKRALRQVLAEEARDRIKRDEAGVQPLVTPPLKEARVVVGDVIRTQDVIDSLIRQKEYKRLKEGAIETYEKHYGCYARKFPTLPLDRETVMGYLEQFKGETGRFRRNQHDLLNMLYKHAVSNFGVPDNPLDGVERPRITQKPIRTLSLAEAGKVDSVVSTVTERAVWQLTIGHGWRQIEVRRITAGDVRSVSEGIIWCRGKEREEDAPLLLETEKVLRELAAGLADGEPVIRSSRKWAGTTHPLRAGGMAELIQRLFMRAGLVYKGHDLRRSFCTLVMESSGDELLAMRLARDKVPGVNN